MEISNSGSITTAAEKLFISQPNLSYSLLNLEKELNTKLFNRSKLGTFPTTSGKLVIQQAKTILKLIDEINDSIQLDNPYLTTTLSVVAIPNISLTILPETLNAFYDRYPNVKLYIYEAGSVYATNSVLQEKNDIALVSLQNDMDYDRKKLSFEPLLTNKPVAYVSRDSPLSNKKEVSIKEILKYPIALFDKDYISTKRMVSLLEQCGKLNIMFNSGNSETIKKVISNTRAIGFFGEVTLKTDPYILSNQIVPIQVKEFKDIYSYHGILTKRDSHTSIASQKFIEELRIQATNFKNLYNLPDYSQVYF